MKPIIASLAAALAVLLLSASAASAQTEGALAKLESLSTGVGLEDRMELPAGYQAKIVFASPKGELYAGVEAVVRRGGEERTLMNSGPWLLLKGEPGEYEIRASAGEAKGKMKIRLPAKGMAVYLIHLRAPAKRGMRN